MFLVSVVETNQQEADIFMNGEKIGQISGSKVVMPGYTLSVDSWQAALDWTYRVFDDVEMAYQDEYQRYQDEQAERLYSGLS